MKKLIPLIIALTAFSVSAVFAQTATSSPSPSPGKHKHAKKPTAAASIAGSPAAVSPSPAKHKHLKKATASASVAGSPAAGSPTPAKHSWFQSKQPESTGAASPAAATTETAPTPAPPSNLKLTETAPSGAVAPGGGPGMVWVNTESHVYHAEGSKWYGKTKQGKYISEADAIKEGDHLDKEETKTK
jgi:hypothetical protein